MGVNGDTCKYDDARKGMSVSEREGVEFLDSRWMVMLVLTRSLLQ